VISFNVKGIHPYDIGSILDKMGIAVRTGHHCAQPIMDYYQIPGTVRASFSFYNTKEEIDQMIVALKRAMAMLQ
jgi:cysteine desulfurase/selenocysteine lyase